MREWGLAFGSNVWSSSAKMHPADHVSMVSVYFEESAMSSGAR
jgi:hypothetical protein